MNSEKPAQLSQKIEYLHDKIDFINKQSKQNGFFELKMKFINFVDTTIQSLYKLDNTKPQSTAQSDTNYHTNHKDDQDQIERTYIQSEKQHLSLRLKQLNQKQRNLENSKLLKENLHKQYGKKQTQLKSYVNELQNKIKAQEKQIQRIVKINIGLSKQYELTKEERNRAEKTALQWKEKYQTQIGVLATFDNKRSKYAFRDETGIRVLRTFTNITTERKGCQRLVFCKLPLKFQVLRLCYGVKLGILHPNHEIQYFNQLSLYEKEEMLLSTIEATVVVLYIKRKVKVQLDKYRLPANNQIVIMLFGNSDSIAIDETEEPKV